MAKRRHDKKHFNSDNTSENPSSSSSENRKRSSSLLSTTPETSLEDLPFLRISGLYTSIPYCHRANRMTVRGNRHHIKSIKPYSRSEAEKVFNAKSASAENPGILVSKSNGTDTNIEKDETKEASKNNKAKSLHPNVSAKSNVFILLTDATGQCFLATNSKKRKSFNRNQNIITEAMSYSKHYNTMNVNKNDTPNTGSTNSMSSSTFENANRISMYDVSTQTVNKCVQKHKYCHILNAHRENNNSKVMSEDNRSSEIISGGIISHGDSLTNNMLSSNTYIMGNSEEVLAKEEHSQSLKCNDTFKLQVNFLKNPNSKDNTISKKTPNKSNKQILSCKESSISSSLCTKSTIVENIPKYLKDQFTKDNYSSYENNQFKNIKENASKTNMIASKTATVENNPTLPPNINISIDGARESYNVQVQYIDGTHEKYTINTIINKINNTDIVSQKSSQKRAIQAPTGDTPTKLNPKTKETNNFTKENLMNFRTFIGNTKASAVPNPPQSQNLSLKQPNVRDTHCDQLHFRRDSCHVKVLVERDREIQRMLGIERRFIPKASKSQPSWSSGLNKRSKLQLKKMTSSSSERIPAEKPTEKNVRNERKYQCHICKKVGQKIKPGVEKSIGEPLDMKIRDQVKENKSKPLAKTKKVNSYSEPCHRKPITVNKLECKKLKSIHHNYRRLTNDRLRLIEKTKNFRRTHSANVNFMKMTRNVLGSSFLEWRKQATFYIKAYHIRDSTGIYQTNAATQTISALEKQNSMEIGSYDYYNVMNERPANMQQTTRNNFTSNKDCTVLTVQGIRRYAGYQRNIRKTLQPFGLRNAVSSTEFREYRKRTFSPICTRSDLKRIHNAERGMATQAGESACIQVPVETSLKKDISICTLFKNQKKPKSRRSPNLGTSKVSLPSNEGSQVFHEEKKPSKTDPQNDRSLLKRLFRFLLRRKSSTTKVVAVGKSGANVWTPVAAVTPDSSEDSYHVNTSLGEIDMSSSIFDTSASNFSQHTIISLPEEKPNRSFLKKIFKIV